MTKEDMQNLIRLVKSNADNNLILLKEILRLKKQVEELEKEREVIDVV
jgi:hypothetical protein